MLNSVGGFIRFTYGYCIRKIGLSKSRYYLLREYINGPDNTDDIVWDRYGQVFINKLVGMISIVAICWIILYFD
jgi:hypothetical protein